MANLGSPVKDLGGVWGEGYFIQQVDFSDFMKY